MPVDRQLSPAGHRVGLEGLLSYLCRGGGAWDYEDPTAYDDPDYGVPPPVSEAPPAAQGPVVVNARPALAPIVVEGIFGWRWCPTADERQQDR